MTQRDREGLARVTTRQLWLRVLPLVILANIVCALSPHPPDAHVTLYETARFLRLQGDHDSWGPMRTAYAAWQKGPRAPLYERVFFRDHVKFQYPPPSLLVIPAQQAMLPHRYQQNDRVLNLLSLLAVLATAVVCAQISGKGEDPAGFRLAKQYGRIAVSILLSVTFFPVVRAFTLGQIQAWLNALFAGALLCWMLDKTRVAGALVGLICVVKPQLSLLLLWAALRKRYGFVVSGLAAIVVIVATSIAVFGWRPHWEYLRVLRFISQRGEVYFANQSLNGLLNRWVFGSLVTFDEHGFPPSSNLVHWLTLATSSVLIVWTLVSGLKNRARMTSVDFAVAGLAFTIASPVAWDDHYGILLPIFALLLPMVRALQPWGKRSTSILGALFIVAGLSIPSTRAAVYPPLNLVQSYLFFVALTVLALLVTLRRRLSSHGAELDATASGPGGFFATSYVQSDDGSDTVVESRVDREGVPIVIVGHEGAVEVPAAALRKVEKVCKQPYPCGEPEASLVAQASGDFCHSA